MGIGSGLILLVNENGAKGFLRPPASREGTS